MGTCSAAGLRLLTGADELLSPVSLGHSDRTSPRPRRANFQHAPSYPPDCCQIALSRRTRGLTACPFVARNPSSLLRQFCLESLRAFCRAGGCRSRLTHDPWRPTAAHQFLMILDLLTTQYRYPMKPMRLPRTIAP